MSDSKELVEKLKMLSTKLGLNNEEPQYWIGHVRAAFNVIKERYPSNQTMRQLCAVIDTMAYKDHLQTIAKSKLREMFNKFDNSSSVGDITWREVEACFSANAEQFKTAEVSDPILSQDYDTYRGDLNHVKSVSDKTRQELDSLEGDNSFFAENEMLSNSALKREIYALALEHQYDKCEEILQLLQHRLNVQEFKQVLSSYQRLLGKIAQVAEDKPVARTQGHPGIATYSPAGKQLYDESFDKELLETGSAISISDIRLT
jgi:hypothetical protein